MSYVTYDNDGRIASYYEYNPPITLVQMGMLYPEANVAEASTGVSSLTHWVAGGTVTDRQALGASWDKTSIVADGSDEAVLSGLPVPCEVTVDGTPVTVEDGTFEFSAGTPGAYVIRVDEPAYLVEEWTVNAD